LAGAQASFGTPYNAILTPPLQSVESQAQGGTAGFLLSANNQTCGAPRCPLPGACREGPIARA